MLGLALFGGGSVLAQPARVQVAALGSGRYAVEVAVDWPTGLQAALDSAGVDRLDDGALMQISRGMLSLTETLELPSLASPRVVVVGSDYDEVNVPAGALNEVLQDLLSADPVTADGLGLMRKQPVVSLTMRLFAYDAAWGVLRRFRRMQIAVEPQPGAAAKAVRQGMNPHLAVERSVLADGVVFKIPITEEGIYRIDRSYLNALLASVGLTPSNIEPNNLQVFGNGGAPLPAPNAEPRIPDLAENPVFVRGGGDGSFDEGDVLLFYGAAPRGWRYDEAAGAWEHYVHPFSNANYYFLKVGTGPGLRVGDASFPDVSGVQVRSQVTGRYVVDLDETVWSKEHGSGHTWVSTQIRSGGAREVFAGVTLPGLEAGTVTYDIRAAIASNPAATLEFEANGAVIGTLRAPRIIGFGPTDPAAVPARATYTQSVAAGQPMSFTMRLRQQINEPQAALDWVRVFYPQRLRASDGLLRFATPGGESGWFEFVLEGFSEAPQVWDVTDPVTIERLGVQPSGNTYRVRVRVDDPGRPRELIAFVESAVRGLDADAATVVPNQNLHGEQAFPELVIITPRAFLEAAGELAEYRRQQGLRVLVAVVEEIYNEFSGGLPDMRAVRDFLKFHYDRATDETNLLRYALLFGDGHYDFRGITAGEGALTNWIFPFETEESFDPDASYTSDDYFGLLDDDEGAWRYISRTSVSNERMDIGVGRFPVQTLDEARMVVDKIRRYEKPDSYGPWRTLYTLVADDGPTGLAGTQNDFDLHVQNIDQVADLLEDGVFPAINLKKIYAESFPRVFLNGFRIPEAKEEIIAALNEGTLLFNYSGHGGPDGLAQEELFTKEDALALTNRDRLAIFITATCSFGWWDFEDVQSGAEALLLNPNGGSVALMTTVRIVYTSSDTNTLNAGLNRALNEILFMRDEEGRPLRLGDVMRLTKNTTVGLQGNSRKFNLLGDPSMRLGLPERSARIEALNGTPLEAQTGQMRALERMTLTGAVLTPDGGVDSGFDGTVDVTVFDAERQVPVKQRRYMPRPYYRVREDLIWRGQVRARAGRFTATFVVPKDISYSNEPGRISVYARSATDQAMGYTENFIVGGTAADLPDDALGPEIALFLNDTTFVSGGLTTREPELIVRLFDESGINTVGAGVGHEMLLVIDGQEDRAEDIARAFKAEENSYQRGEVRWPLSGLEPGPHQLQVRAWDVLNNASTAELAFIVTEEASLTLRNVFNYPNPMNRFTRFVFEHNQPPGTPARVQVRIYTLNGRPIRTLEGDEALPGGILPGGPVQIPWDGLDQDFDRVASGIYLYKVRVEVENPDGERNVVERIEKLAVIR